MLDFLVAMGFKARLDSRSYTSFFTLNNVFVHDGFFVFYYTNNVNVDLFFPFLLVSHVTVRLISTKVRTHGCFYSKVFFFSQFLHSNRLMLNEGEAI